MKNGFRLFALALFLFLVPHLHAADVTGTWKGNFDFQGHTAHATLHLTADGASVTGTVEHSHGQAAEIHEGKIEKDKLSFWIDADYGGASYKVLFSGKVEDGKIEFSIETDDGVWGTDFTAKKVSEATTKDRTQAK